MTTRLNYGTIAPGVYEAMDALDTYISGSGLDPALVDLVRLRASQINGCAFCIDMHWRDLRGRGEREQRLYALSAWRESPFYSDREMAALEWTEAVTLVSADHVPDRVYESVSKHFSPKELCDLTLAIATINAWNRLSIAARLIPKPTQ
jgi:AhpD family alkylhydroperoxidase